MGLFVVVTFLGPCQVSRVVPCRELGTYAKYALRFLVYLSH